MRYYMESSSVKILVIDDMADNHIAIKALIMEAIPDTTVISAYSGLSGLELALAENPDVILLDVVMPDMDGFAVCRRLKSDPKLSDIPLVFVTALKGDKETRIKALEVGAEAFLTKPIDEIELTAQIRAMVKIKKANAEKRSENTLLTKLVESQVQEIKDSQVATLNMLEDVIRENEARKRSEEALQKSEEKYRKIFENVQDVFYQVDLNGIIRDISPSISYFSKFTREELIGTPMCNLYYDQEECPQLIKAIKANGQIRDHEARFKSKTGEVNYVSINASLIDGSELEDKHIDGAIRDIHSRKLAEQRLSLTSRILNAFNTTAPLIESCQTTINLIQASTGCDAIAIRLKKGDDYPYFVHKGFSQVFIDTENFIVKRDATGRVSCDSADALCMECTCGMVLTGKEKRTNTLLSAEGSFWTNNSPALLDIAGSDDPRINPRNVCINHGYHSFALIPVRVKGDIIGLLQINHFKGDAFYPEQITMFESIGEIIGVALMRKQAEEALEQSHALLFNLSEQVPGVVYQYRLYPDGRSAFPYASSGMNDIYEVTPEEVREDATPVFGRLHPEDRDRVTELIFESARLQKHFYCEYRVLLPRQGLRWRYSDAMPQLLEDNSTLWHGIIYDITDRKETEKNLMELNDTLELRVKQRTADLESANKELETFSYSVSHDLKAPLRHISGFIGLFLENKSTSLTEEEMGYLQKVTEASAEMAQLIDALLSFSRLNMAALRKSKIDSHQMVKQVIDFFQPEIEHRKVIFNIGKLPVIMGDEDLIRQVWTNLISNAIKYTSKREEAIIEIGCESDQLFKTFFIKDNGAGFNMKYAEKLFGVFQRLHKTRDFEGVGIGLANVNRIIKRHGGKCFAEAEPDQGATFYFSLPD